MSLSPLGVSNMSLAQSLPCGRWTEAWWGMVAMLSWSFRCCLAVNNNVVIEHLPCPGTGLSALKALSYLIFRKPWEKGRCSNYHHVTDEKASAKQALAVPRVTEPGNGGAGSQNYLESFSSSSLLVEFVTSNRLTYWASLHAASLLHNAVSLNARGTYYCVVIISTCLSP